LAVPGCSSPRATAGAGRPTGGRPSWPGRPAGGVPPSPILARPGGARARRRAGGAGRRPGLPGAGLPPRRRGGLARWPPGSVPGVRGAGLATGVRLGSAQPGDPPGQGRLTGTVTGVADALLADVLLVPADGVPFGLYAVDAGAPGVSRAAVVSLDATRPLCNLAFDSAPARPVATGEAAAQAVASALA